MKETTGKIHFINQTAVLADYIGKPHLITAITIGQFTACEIITVRVTGIKEDVTCSACMELLKES